MRTTDLVKMSDFDKINASHLEYIYGGKLGNVANWVMTFINHFLPDCTSGLT